MTLCASLFRFLNSRRTCLLSVAGVRSGAGRFWHFLSVSSRYIRNETHTNFTNKLFVFEVDM